VNSRVLSFASLASPLARSQAQAMIDRIEDHLPRVICQLNILPSPIPDMAKTDEVFVAMSGGEAEYLCQGLFQDQARLVVAAATDLMHPLPDGLDLVCVPDRALPFDAYLNREGLIMDDMEAGCRVGVVSMRSRSQMSGLWPNLRFEILRGGVDRAMENHLKRAELDGLVLPAVVTEHLGIQGIVAEIFAPGFVLPSPRQGVLVIVGRADDHEAREMLAGLHSPDTAVELVCEQAFCNCMISDQDQPVGALAKVEGNEVSIIGATGAGTNRIVVNGPIAEAEAVGAGLAQQILSSGESFADLLEAEFPDGLPEDPDDPNTSDEDAEILGDLNHDGDQDEDDHELGEMDDLEHLKALEDLAGISEEPDRARGDDDEDKSYD